MRPRVQVKSKLLKDDRDRIKYRVFHKGGREHYNLRIYIDGSERELAKIKKVQYVLHPSFGNPRRMSTDAANGFPIEIWTWGLFDIEVTYDLVGGTTASENFYLKYSLPADTGSTYVDLSA